MIRPTSRASEGFGEPLGPAKIPSMDYRPLSMTPQEHIVWTSKRIAKDVRALLGENVEDRAECLTQLYISQLLDSLGVRVPSDEEVGK